jgi:lysophospholipase L1-like esterase
VAISYLGLNSEPGGGKALGENWDHKAVVWLTLLQLLCGAMGVSAQPKISRWEPEIAAFERADQTNPPPQESVLFIGSSAIRKWTTLAKDFPGISVINRGFGGSQIADSTAFASRIIFPYHPRLIVLYAGDNDLAAGKSSADIVAEYKDFVRTVHAQLPETPIAFISIKPSPSRWRLKEKIVETNRQIAALRDDRLLFINIYPAMLNADGQPKKELFLADGLHPNKKGYQVWAAVIRPYLEIPANK